MTMFSNVLKGAPIVAAAALAATSVATPASAAETVYDVSDANGEVHGLWTNGLFGANSVDPANYFSIASALFTLDDLGDMDPNTFSATFAGTAVNPDGYVAVFNLALSDWHDTPDGSFQYKTEQGANYDPTLDIPDIDFFTGGSGTIDIYDDMNNLLYSLTIDTSDPFRDPTAWQYGPGANAKDDEELGASAWVNTNELPQHFDFNVGLSAVPEPSTWAMLLLGFFGIGGTLRRTRREKSGVLASA
ncbi:PEPxxWA-CTERM sorting domain-containing protein [Qipengyuania vesicularis]|uniref:PEPxxWA-CTERM sorting domain-containing protein n=1 Tax=Qipengyuania vesicularis TaxID=2867232 RepID=UPI001FFDEBC6|nr:PEPxxWA-CTERM sorting domain-containing protein [Qipengyuania vesicularis]